MNLIARVVAIQPKQVMIEVYGQPEIKARAIAERLAAHASGQPRKALFGAYMRMNRVCNMFYFIVCTTAVSA